MNKLTDVNITIQLTIENKTSSYSRNINPNLPIEQIQKKLDNITKELLFIIHQENQTN